MKKLAHEAFQKVTVEMVRNCIEHVKEQEVYYKHLHKIQSLPVEDTATEVQDIAANSEGNTENGITFDNEGQILPVSEETEVVTISTIPETSLSGYACSFCDYTSVTSNILFR